MKYIVKCEYTESLRINKERKNSNADPVDYLSDPLCAKLAPIFEFYQNESNGVGMIVCLNIEEMRR